jgi:hypothetical protein
MIRRPHRRIEDRSLRCRKCLVCAHKDLPRIELLRTGGAAMDALALEFGVSRDSLYRHFANHFSDKRRAELMVGPAQVERLAVAAASESKSLLDQFSIVRSVLFNQFLTAAETNDRHGLVNIAGKLLESLRELGKLTGELRSISGINITNNHLTLVASPEFKALADGLLTIARRHPEAKGDIINLLRGLDDAERAEPHPKPNGAHPPMMEHEAALHG